MVAQPKLRGKQRYNGNGHPELVSGSSFNYQKALKRVQDCILKRGREAAKVQEGVILCSG